MTQARHDHLRSDPLPGHDLVAFVAAVQLGSIQGAADALSLTQSAVTKRVQALERRVGATLLERGRHGARLTDAGGALYEPARRALAALSTAEDSLLAHLGEEARALRLAASHTIGEFLLPRWLSEFGRDHGPIHPNVEILPSPGVVEAVRKGQVELGFVEHDEPLDDLRTLTLCRDELVAVVAPGHRWASRAAVGAEELPGEPFFVREQGSGTRSVALGRLRSAGVSLSPALEVGSTESLKRAVLAEGFTLISSLTVEHEEEVGRLRAIHVEGVDLTRELRAVRDLEAGGGPGSILWRWLEQRVETPTATPT
jgi:DNA-binding transcriptional LysR family regulator